MRWKTFYGSGSADDQPYLTRIFLLPSIFGYQLVLHIFHRGDVDPEMHDHPWDFWSFPLTSYLEEVPNPKLPARRVEVVKRFRLHYRPAEYKHRVISVAGDYPLLEEGIPDDSKIYTICLLKPKRREWGFWRQSVIQSGDGARAFPSIFWVPWQQFCDEKRAQRSIADDIDRLPDWEVRR